MKFIHVHMSERTVVAETVPDAYRGIGGRALTSSLHQRPCPRYL